MELGLHRQKLCDGAAKDFQQAATGRLYRNSSPAAGQGIENLITARNGQGACMASKASAVWTGSLKEGKGSISTATGVLSNANYSFATRFEGSNSGTTPEELIAAAHASCFSMALGAQLGGAGFTPTKIETHAAVTLAKVGDGFSITKITLDTTADVPGATKEAFDTAATNAKAGCPISKLFANNTEIVLNAKLA
jgi:osmotically inducible protein OsmC